MRNMTDEEFAKAARWADQPEFQLQFWNGKTYNPSVANDKPDYLRGLVMPESGPWRIVKQIKERPLKPRYALPAAARCDRTIEEMCEAYCAWAVEKGLERVHVYEWAKGGNYWSGVAAERHSLAPVYVNRSEFLGPAPAPEEVPDGD